LWGKVYAGSVVARRVQLAFQSALDAHERAATKHEEAAALFLRHGNAPAAESEEAMARRERNRIAEALAKHPDWSP
jgi:hypothetical protein